MLRAFVAYWYAQRGANLVTRRADFEIFRFAPLLPHIFLYDYDSRTRELTLRLAGEEIRRMLPNSVAGTPLDRIMRSEEHTSGLQSLMRISYAVFCLKKKKHKST